jgi:hypothetical protein
MQAQGKTVPGASAVALQARWHLASIDTYQVLIVQTAPMAWKLLLLVPFIIYKTCWQTSYPDVFPACRA